MRPERWQEILDQVRQNFTVEDEGEETSDEQGGTVLQYIEFNGPLGRLRLEFTTHPALLDTKTTYHKRIGSETEVKYIYSPTDKVHSLGVYRWDENESDWIPFETKAFSE